MYERYIKRLLDIMVSGFSIIILSPLLAVISLAIVIDDPGPVFFRQKRIAKDSKEGRKQFFNILKFRTMKTSTPPNMPTHLLTDPAQFITKVGSFLRRTSLDELPQLINIFLGQMSIVGPRPALYNQDDLYFERSKHGANAVIPGLTGLAQVLGRDGLEIRDKAKIDGEYSQNISFRLDIKCILMTIQAVLKREGVVEGGTGELKRQAKQMSGSVKKED